MSGPSEYRLVQQAGHVGAGVHRADDAADDLLLPLGKTVKRQRGPGVGHRVDVGDDDPAALGREGEDPSMRSATGIHRQRSAAASATI
jgi:hypothetical protein